jgi:hypothetical protein
MVSWIHNPEVGSSNLPPATSDSKRLGVWGFLEKGNVCTMSVQISHFRKALH